MKNKTITKAKGIINKTKPFLKKVDLKFDEAVKSVQKKWKADQPKRDKYKKIIKADANKFMKNSVKMSKDVIATINKDLKSFKKQK